MGPFEIPKSVAAGSLVEVGTRATAFLILGAILAGGGYSHAAPRSARKGTAKAVPLGRGTGFVPPTFGIVTQIEGSIYVLRGEWDLEKPGSAVGKVKLGDALAEGSRIWVEEGASFAVADGRGSAFLVQGPSALVASKGAIETLGGTFLLVGRSGRSDQGACGIELRTPYSAACSSGEMASWVSPSYSQTVAVRGKTKVWHPALSARAPDAESAVELAAGWFTESSPKFRHLQPKRARMVEPRKGSALLAQLGALWEPTISQEAGGELLAAQRGRKRGSDRSEENGDSRTAADVTEKKDEALLERFNERVFARGASDFRPEEVYSALEVAGPKHKRQAVRMLASVGAPHPAHALGKRSAPKISIRDQGRQLDEEQRTLLENLKEKVPRF